MKLFEINLGHIILVAMLLYSIATVGLDGTIRRAGEIAGASAALFVEGFQRTYGQAAAPDKESEG